MNYFWFIFLPPSIIYITLWIISIKIQPKYRIVERTYMDSIDYQIQKYNIVWGWHTIEKRCGTVKAAEFHIWNMTAKPSIKVVSEHKG